MGQIRTRKEGDPARGTHFLETTVGQVRRKETNRARGTHFLETAEVGTSQDTEKNRASEGHSLPRDRGGGDKSRHRKELIERGALTSWR